MKTFLSPAVALCVFLTAMAMPLRAVTTSPLLHPLFTNNMVLQRDASDPVWGWANPGTTITVTVYDPNNAVLQTKTATAAADGSWKTTIGPFSLVAGNAAYHFTVATSGSSQTVSNVLIGDVWLCSGQSNMEYTLYGNYPEGGGTRLANSTNEIAAAQAAASAPYIRQFKASHAVASTPQSTFVGGVDSGGWTVASSNARAFTAIGYFMAKQIYDSQQVPIGLLALNWGGTSIHPWIPADYLRTLADYTPTVDTLSTTTVTSSSPCAIYNAMVAPVAGLQIKGAVWYQGENEGLTLYGVPPSGGPKYQALLKQYLAGTRATFGQPNLPFVLVQLSTNGSNTTPVQSSTTTLFAEVREAQLNTALGDPNTRVVTTVDCGFGGSNADIHPIDKQTPGKRVGQAALDLAYGQVTEYRTPTFNHASVEGGTLRCYFDNIGSGLMVGLKPQGLSQNAPPSPSPVSEVNGGTLTGFSIAGSDKTWYAATATIDSATNTVVVYSASVPSPLYVRYGWCDNPWNTTSSTPLCNLYRKILSGASVVDGVPVSPFRNDPAYQLSVNSGTPSGMTYTPGQVVAVTAAGAPAGQSFAFWTGDTGVLASATSLATTATLSQPYVSLRAIYQLNTAPSGLTVTPGTTQNTLSWTALTNAISYNIYRCATSGGTPSFLASGVLTTSYTDTTAGAGATWYYSVSAVNPAGESPQSGQVAGVTLDSNAPTGLAATAGNAQVALSWTSNGATSYNVKRSLTGGSGYVVLTNTAAASYTDATAVNGTTYYYVVSAIHSGVESGNSAEVSATPPGNTAWTGTTSANWSVASNWGGGATPLNNATLAFNTATTTALNNDLSNFILGGLLFNSGASAFTLSGNSAKLAGDILNNSTSAQTINLPMLLTKNATVSANTGAVTLGGVIGENGGSFGLAKTGGGTLTLNGASTFSGGVTLSAGTLTPGVASVGASGSITSSAIGTGTLTLAGGTLQLNNKTLYNALAVTGSATIDEITNNGVLAGPASGSGNLTLNNTSGTNLSLQVLNGDWSGFTGTITYNGGVSRTHNLLFGSTTTGTWDLSHATFVAANTSNGVLSGGVANANLTIKLGTLSGSGIIDSAFNSSTTTYEIGARSEDSVFSGIFKNSNGTATTALTKVGGGLLILSGANTYKGATAINGGTLAFTGTMTGTGALAVNNTGTLGGTATLPMAVTVNNGGAIAPGVGGVGTLTLSGSLTLSGGAVLNIDVLGTGNSDKLALTGGYTASGVTTVNVSALPGFAGVGTYPILTGATGISAANFALGTTPSGYAVKLSASSGTLSVVVSAPDAPADLVATAGDGQVGVSWNASAGATSYTVLRSTTSGSGYAQVTGGTTTATGFTDTTVTNGTTYYYVVTATNLGGTSAASNQAGAQPLSARQSWRLSHFGTISNSGSAADTADPDGDGRSNLLEYATGSDPNDTDAGPAAVLGETADGTRLTLTFTRIADSSLTYTVQASNNLTSPWTDIWSSTGAANTEGSITVPDTEDLSANLKRFLRLKISP
jgi:autotransporter-associated beta strand protein